MKLKVRSTSASKTTIAGCDKLLAVLKDRGPQYFSELLAAMGCTKGQLTFYTRRLSTQQRILCIEKRGTMIRWGLPEHLTATPALTAPRGEFAVAGRRRPISRGPLNRDVFEHMNLAMLSRR